MGRKQASKTKVEKPDKTMYCQMSGKPLKMKDLIDMTRMPKKSIIAW